jgi:hydrogenase maturation protease
LLENAPLRARASVLVLGLGNALLSDDGAGLHALQLLKDWPGEPDVVCCDGGTIGLALLGEIAQTDSLIVLDAASFGGAPGEVRVFEGDAFDARVRSARASAHDLALAELIDAAHLADALPQRRALIGVEPASVEWGLSPTAPVAAALPRVAALARAYAAAWRGLTVPEMTA